MWTTTHIIAATIAAASAGSVMAFILVKIFDRLRRRDAVSEAASIIAKGKEDAETRRREGELQIKELLLKQQDESEKEHRKIRGELHERERLLDKRQDALEEQAEVLRKQEKNIEATQRKLTERIQEVNHRKEDLAKLIDVQRQTLHELSGLNQADATRRLLELLNAQLQQETGAAILRYDKQLAETCEQKAREIIVTARAALRRRPHRRVDHQHGGHPQRRNEGPHHRPRGTQHPRLRKGHRRGPDHRRHAGRGHRQRLRHGPPRDRPARR